MIRFVKLDVAANFGGLVHLLEDEQPEAIIHFAEQRAAPYSMKSATTKTTLFPTISTAPTTCLMPSLRGGQDIHLVHLGTMGVYGYGHDEPVPIPEGYLPVKIETQMAVKSKIPSSTHPILARSIT